MAGRRRFRPRPAQRAAVRIGYMAGRVHRRVAGGGRVKPVKPVEPKAAK